MPGFPAGGGAHGKPARGAAPKPPKPSKKRKGFGEL